MVLDAQSRAIYFSRSVIPYLRGVERSQWLAHHTFYKHLGLYALSLIHIYVKFGLPGLKVRSSGAFRTEKNEGADMLSAPFQGS